MTNSLYIDVHFDVIIIQFSIGYQLKIIHKQIMLMNLSSVKFCFDHTHIQITNHDVSRLFIFHVCILIGRSSSLTNQESLSKVGQIFDVET